MSTEQQTQEALRFTTMRDVERANTALGHHWFEASSMRFFGTRIVGGLVAGRYFISSEKQPTNHYSQNPVSYPRLYSIRQANPDGSIDTVGDFQQYATLYQARKALAAIIAAQS